MFDFLLLWRCIRGPQLFRIYQQHPSRVRLYYPNLLEIWATKVITWIRVLMILTLILTTSYFFLNLYLVGFSSTALIMFAVANIIPIFVGMIAHVLKGIGRMKNPKYVSFYWIYYRQDINRLRLFDFDFKFWPVSFRLNESTCIYDNCLGDANPYEVNLNPHMFCLWAWLTQTCGFLFNHLCATDFIYPGSNSNWYRRNERVIENGRKNLILKHSGMRSKICTIDGNHIDTMHIDRRTQDMPRYANILVICCEGRHNYYENGIMRTPIFAGYSVLGWNAPGFANSTGRPYPRQVKNAIEAVVQFAIKVLRFKQSDIVLFGWNIGTYAAAWGAVMFPDILSLVLDAPFDDIIELSPRNPLSREVVCKYFDLNVCDVLLKYDGPIHIIRRVYDEVMSMPYGRHLYTNRTNYVTFHLITTRYHQFSNHYYSYTLLESLSLEEEERVKVEVVHPHYQTRKCLNLVSTYMSDFKASHTAPLPTELLIRAIDDSVEEEPMVQVVIE